MPIYEYICQKCQSEFELIRPIKDADMETTCAHCQSKNTKRKLSLFNATSSGRTLSGASSCSGCAGGSCSSCGSH